MAGRRTGVFALLKLYAKMDLNWLLQDFKSAVIVIFSETLMNISGMMGVLLLAYRFGGVGGLSADEILFMLGFYELANGIGWVFFGNYNVMHISRRIGRGQADHMLIQPRPIWMQLLTEGFMPFSGSGSMVAGAVLTAVAVSRLQIALSAAWFLLLVFYIVVHIVLIAAQSVLYGSLAFRNPVSCEEISSVIIDLNNQLGRYPLIGLPKWLSGLLFTVVPVALTAFLPALALLKDLGKEISVTLHLVVSLIFLIFAVIAFRKGLVYYEKHSCSRYKEMGFRC